MSRKKKSLPVTTETPFSPAAFIPSCDNCPYFKKLESSVWGECRRRLANYTNPKNLTPHGPLGNFYYMSRDGVCGDHPHFLSPPDPLPNT